MIKKFPRFHYLAWRCTLLGALTIVLPVEKMPAADQLQGAAVILKSVAAPSADPKEAKPLSDSARLRLELTNFSARAASLAPAVAAQEWLKIYDRVATSSPSGFSRAPAVQMAEVIMALPPPTAWEDLAKAINQRPAPAQLKDASEFGLRLLAYALTGDRAALAKLSSEFEALLLKADASKAAPFLQLYRQLDTSLLASSDDPKAVRAAVERQLLAAERGRDYGYSSVGLPDLVTLIGEAEATPYVRRALVSKAQNLDIEGKATMALARRLALESINDLQVPRWDLIDSLESTELYEAFAKKFPDTKGQEPANAADALAELESRGFGENFQKQQAAAYYLMSLIVKGRTADATAFARRNAKGDGQMPTAAVTSLGRAGYNEALDNFLAELLTQNPELPYWQAYFKVAAHTGKTDRMLKVARTAAAKPELSGEKSGNIRQNLYQALLAADLVDEGIEELRSLLATAPKEAARPNRSALGMSQEIEWSTHALTLARLGILLEKPALVAEGIKAATPQGGGKSVSLENYSGLAQLRWLLEVLLENGQLAESEKLAAEALTAATAESTAEERYPGRGGMSAGAQPLAWLVGIYHQAARPQDVLMLLDESPHWGAKDLAALTSSSYGGIDIDFESFRNRHSTSGSKGNQLVQATATALLAAGRKAEARTLVDHTLNNTGGDDRAYELLLRIAGPEARARLDELFARDQFEERPLIWKAVLLHQAGQHEEAEKLARQAIAIDPSDGEQGQGDRMRVYAVLADIRAARGEPKDAEFFRGVVRAIRLSEQADRFMNAGLMTRAVKMYQDSLLHFADAYCIQSRLAVQLTELGQHELAAKHYEKAFELMPDSFGRVESHCFGCESTFAATQAQGVAERVFTTLVDKNPNKPQVHYLLGYLRLQQQRGQEALPHFRRALELDPDYLNAWTRLQDLSKQYRLPASERDRITLNILRLDPLSRHSSPDLDTVSDLKALWTAVERAQKLRLRPATQLYPLTASKKAIEEQEAKKQPDLSSSHHWGRLGARSSDRTPASALLSHSVIQAIAELMSGSNRADF